MSVRRYDTIVLGLLKKEEELEEEECQIVIFYFARCIRKLITINNKSKNGKVQEIKNTARLPRPETGGRVGWRCSHRLALPHHKAIANMPNKCLEVMAGSGEPTLSAMARPMDRTVWMVSSARPPKVSATRGMKSVPVERQAERFEANLEGMPRCVRSLRYGLLLEKADDVDVKGSRSTTAPVSEEDVCWARLRTRDKTGVPWRGPMRQTGQQRRPHP